MFALVCQGFGIDFIYCVCTAKLDACISPPKLSGTLWCRVHFAHLQLLQWHQKEHLSNLNIITRKKVIKTRYLKPRKFPHHFVNVSAALLLLPVSTLLFMILSTISALLFLYVKFRDVVNKMRLNVGIFMSDMSNKLRCNCDCHIF